MKPLGFLVSLLFHLLFLLLIVTVRFPVIELDRQPQIIQIVPMSPPLSDSPPLRVPAAVFVRPFVSRGGAQGNSRGQLSGKGNGSKTGLPTRSFSRGRSSIPTARSERPEPAIKTAAAIGSGVPDGTGKRLKLTVDLDRVAQRLREQKKAEEPAGNLGFIVGQEVEGLPFGESPAGGVSPSGDGTSSHALGGNAFFDSGGYDITPWARRMVYRVKKNWIFPPVSQYGMKGVVGIYLLIGRTGTIGNIHIRKTSGIRPFDQAAFNAIELSAPFPPLPDDFPHADLQAYLLFYYN
jgi:TonB family protein